MCCTFIRICHTHGKKERCKRIHSFRSRSYIYDARGMATFCQTFSMQSISSLVARCYVLERTPSNLQGNKSKCVMIRPHIPCNFFAIHSMNSFPSLLARCYVAAQAECWSVHGPIWRGQRQRQPGQQPLSSPRSASEFIKYVCNNIVDD